MDMVEQAERQGRALAICCLVLAALLLLAEIVGSRLLHSDFADGFWLGMALVCALTLMPWRRWLRPTSSLNRLLDDEGVREHRRMSCTAGFWAALLAALATAPLAHDTILAAYDVSRVVATAALVAAMIAFGTLELRAAR